MPLSESQISERNRKYIDDLKDLNLTINFKLLEDSFIDEDSFKAVKGAMDTQDIDEKLKRKVQNTINIMEDFIKLYKTEDKRRAITIEMEEINKRNDFYERKRTRRNDTKMLKPFYDN